ncbi:hypothetical protein KUV51_01735 [Tateyamaria omphalii]|uniref:hypothetical protein n=1 Tax=Tateyamaria omphalii TaxID=299262 RepID=UPI001C9907FA|nr:hypothetical protein [Tateyamaria omphalii]MBY5931705.1 hypothetical protein [Tateyamaria omphalii]
MVSRALQFCKLSLICAVMVALATIGFAHQTAQPETPSPELAAYVAAGGSLADLCGPFDGGSQVHIQKCEACRISDTALWPSGHCTDRPLTLAKIFAFSFIAKRLIERHGLDAARLVRAPPHA